MWFVCVCVGLQLPDSVQMPPLDATRYDRALTHPLLVALEQRVSVDQSRQRYDLFVKFVDICRIRFELLGVCQ
jgi:hypothetical protein